MMVENHKPHGYMRLFDGYYLSKFPMQLVFVYKLPFKKFNPLNHHVETIVVVCSEIFAVVFPFSVLTQDFFFVFLCEI